MVKKKIIFTGLSLTFLVLVVLTVTTLVSAKHNWWHIWGEDVREAPFEATVTLTNDPPSIIAIWEAEDVEGTGTFSDTVTPLDCDASPNSINLARIWFKASDSNGASDLPGGTEAIDRLALGETLGVDGNIEMYVTNPGIDYAANNYYFSSAACRREAACPRSGSCSANEMEFSCDLSMDHDFEPGSWTIFLAISDPADDTGNNAGLGPGNGDPVDPNSFDYAQNVDFNTVPDGTATIAFNPVDVSATDQVDNGPLIMDNCGNVDFVAGTLQGSDMTTDDIPADGNDLPATAFAVSISEGIGGDSILDECAGETDNNAVGDGQTADELITASGKAIDADGAPTLNYDRGGSQDLTEELHFCIWQQLNSLGLSLDNVYSSSPSKGTTPGTPGNAWEVILTT